MRNLIIPIQPDIERLTIEIHPRYDVDGKTLWADHSDVEMTLAGYHFKATLQTLELVCSSVRKELEKKK